MRHRSAVADITDRAKVDAVYVPEVIDFEDPFADVNESTMITSGSEFHYSPDHRWW